MSIALLPAQSTSVPCSLAHLLRLRAGKTPEEIAYTFIEKDLVERGNRTYLELDRQARAIAAQLGRRCQAGDRALLVYGAGLEFVAAFFGCIYANVIAIPVPVPDLRRTAPVFFSIAQDAQARVLLTTASLLQDTVPDLKEGLPASMEFLATDSIPSGDSSTDLPGEAVPDTSVAYLQYTSGSTSKPRGVMVTHANVLNNLHAIDADFRHDSQSVSLTWLPHFHDMGLVYGILQPIFSGFPCMVLSPTGFSQDPSIWLQAISKYRVTHSGGPNFAYDLCARKISNEQKAEFDLSSWRVAFNGAEPIHADTLKRFAEAFAPCGFRKESLYMAYGLAEGTLKVSGRYYDSSDAVDVVQTSELGARHAVRTAGPSQMTTSVVSCGASALDTQVQIIESDSGRICAEDEIGEVWVKGPGVAAGYWNNLERTKEIFNAQVTADDFGYLRTGDLGYVSRGQLFLTGRIKDLIIVRGRNFYPHDIEATVAGVAAQGGKGLAVVFSACLESQERVVLIQEIMHRIENFAPLADEILSAVMLGHGLAVDVLAFVRFGKIPRTTSGKVRRNAVREQFIEDNLDIVWKRSTLERASGEPVQPPKTEIEIRLHEIWCAVLGRTHIGVTDRFLDLGGDSVVAAQLSARATAAFGIDLPVQLIFEQSCIAGLASHIEELQAAEAMYPLQREELDDLLARIDQLSGEELDLHLNRLLAKIVVKA